MGGDAHLKRKSLLENQGSLHEEILKGLCIQLLFAFERNCSRSPY
jgi:hypothetical protein